MDEPHITDHAIDKFLEITAPSREAAKGALLKMFMQATKTEIPPGKTIARLINNSKNYDYKDAQAQYYELGGYRFVIVNNVMVTFEKRNY